MSDKGTPEAELPTTFLTPNRHAQPYLVKLVSVVKICELVALGDIRMNRAFFREVFDETRFWIHWF